MTRSIRHMFVLCLALMAAASCGRREAAMTCGEQPPIFPDYAGVTVPANIAPLNFEVREAERVVAVVRGSRSGEMIVTGDSAVEMDVDKWHALLGDNRGGSLSIEVSVWNDRHKDGLRYAPFSISVDDSDIDSHLTYRLQLLGYVGWNKMGIYQRDLTTFDEMPLITNDQNHKGCVNCHTPCKGSPDLYMYHARGRNGATVLVRNGQMEKVHLEKLGPRKQGIYPAWHPGGRYLALTTNNVLQTFYMHCQNKIEVYDTASDLIVYDCDRRCVITDERFCDSLWRETFPTFSPDGKRLYFCTARARIAPQENSLTHYSIVGVDFHDDGSLGGQVDTVYSASRMGGSASLPRISPDGRWMLFARSSSGTFHIQDRDADLAMLDLQGDSLVDCSAVNSPEAESYHSWSSNGRWVVFSTRRIDGRYTRLCIAAFRDGRWGKPFLLPQRTLQHDRRMLYVYNTPEFATGAIRPDADAVANLFE